MTGAWNPPPNLPFVRRTRHDGWRNFDSTRSAFRVGASAPSRLAPAQVGDEWRLGHRTGPETDQTDARGGAENSRSRGVQDPARATDWAAMDAVEVNNPGPHHPKQGAPWEMPLTKITQTQLRTRLRPYEEPSAPSAVLRASACIGFLPVQDRSHLWMFPRDCGHPALRPSGSPAYAGVSRGVRVVGEVRDRPDLSNRLTSACAPRSTSISSSKTRAS